MTEPLVAIENLVVTLPVDGSMQAVLRGIDLQVAAGEAVGLVGESGSGKSMTARAVDRLLPSGAVVEGSVHFDGNDVYDLSGEALRRFRGEVAMIFQDPRAHINPVRRLGDFMTEAVIAHRSLTRHDAERRAIELLDAVRVTDPRSRLRQYPHELSGGMLQRVMIATALLARPRLLLADEPTTALDVTTQSDVTALLDELRREFGLAMLFITHNLELAAAICDRTVVMYAGQVMEVSESHRIDTHPRHPYTAALLRARPRLDASVIRLDAIPGQPLSAFAAPRSECAFAARCTYTDEACLTAIPALEPVEGGLSRCTHTTAVQDRLVINPPDAPVDREVGND